MGKGGWLWGEKSVKKWAISWRGWVTVRQGGREVLGAWEREREEIGPFQDHWSGQDSTWSNQFLYFQLIFHAQLIYGPDGGTTYLWEISVLPQDYPESCHLLTCCHENLKSMINIWTRYLFDIFWHMIMLNILKFTCFLMLLCQLK
jgi:hypothetical protein